MSVRQLGREVLDIAAKAVKVGITTAEIDKIVYEVGAYINHAVET